MTFRWAVLLAAAMSVTLTAQGGPPVTPPRQVAPPRDTVREPQPTAVIRGKVTAEGTGEPLNRVRITLNGALSNPPTATTDARGEFDLQPVPVGTFTITAARAGFLTVRYGQRRPREAGRTVTVEKDQVIDGIDIAMPRGAVLAGRLTDELGEPMASTFVEAVDLRYIKGRRVAVAARTTWTNDLGDYRLANLEPGTYQVRASSRDVWESDDGRATYTYAITYFPGVSAAERPAAVTIASGQQMVGLNFHLVPGRAARVTGVVLDANGTPMAGQVVHLSEIARTVGGALFSSGPGPTTKTDAAGSFDCPKLPPGEYLAVAGGPKDSVMETVVVQAGDSKHVVLAVQKPSEASGSIVTDEDTAPPFPASRLNVVPIATDPDNVLPAWGGASDTTPKSDWSFRVPNTDGHYLFRITGLPDQWMLRRVLLGGRDVTDTPIAIQRGGPDASGLQLVISRKGARIEGQVVDRGGDGAPDSTVIVFAENRSLWGAGSRFIRAVRPDKTGRFSVGGLPAAAYRVIAQDLVIDGQWEDPEFLDSVYKQAKRVELAEEASAKIMLTIQEPVR